MILGLVFWTMKRGRTVGELRKQKWMEAMFTDNQPTHSTVHTITIGFVKHYNGATIDLLSATTPCCIQREWKWIVSVVFGSALEWSALACIFGCSRFLARHVGVLPTRQTSSKATNSYNSSHEYCVASSFPLPPLDFRCSDNVIIMGQRTISCCTFHIHFIPQGNVMDLEPNKYEYYFHLYYASKSSQGTQSE